MTTLDKQLNDTFLADVPRKNWQKMFFKAPLQAWRMGFKFLLPPNFACITTQGRKSGMPRHTMVEFSEIDGKYYFASGWQEKPHWVQNLMAYPQVTVHPVRGEPIWGTAERVQDDDTLKALFEAMQVSPVWKPWLASLDIEPTVEDFVAHKDRVYVYQVTPDEGNMVMPTLPQDRRWVVWAVLGVLALMSRIRFRRRKSETES